MTVSITTFCIKCHYAENRDLFIVMRKVVKLDVIMLGVVILGVVILGVVILGVVMLSVVVPSCGQYYKHIMIVSDDCE